MGRKWQRPWRRETWGRRRRRSRSVERAWRRDHVVHVREEAALVAPVHQSNIARPEQACVAARYGEGGRRRHRARSGGRLKDCAPCGRPQTPRSSGTSCIRGRPAGLVGRRAAASAASLAHTPMLRLLRQAKPVGAVGDSMETESDCGGCWEIVRSSTCGVAARRAAPRPAQRTAPKRRHARRRRRARGGGGGRRP